MTDYAIMYHITRIARVGTVVKNGIALKELFDNQFRMSIVNRINGIFNGDGLLKKIGKKVLNGITVGGLGRLLFVKADKSIRKKKFIDLAGDIGLAIFAGDQPYVAGTPVGDAFEKVFSNLSPVISGIEKKLMQKGTSVNLKQMLMNTIGNNKGYSDNNTVIDLRK